MLYPSMRQWGKGAKTWERRKRSETIFPNAKELRSTSMMPPSRESQTQLEEPVRDFHYTAGLRSGVEARREAMYDLCSIPGGSSAARVSYDPEG